MPLMPSTVCPKCGGRFKGRYCPTCSVWGKDGSGSGLVGRGGGGRIAGQRVSPWVRIQGSTWLRAQWFRLRKEAMALYGGVCVWCGAPGRQVDHIDGTDYYDDSGTGASWLNLAMVRLLCTPCHRRRTAEQGAQKRWGSEG